MSESNYEQSQQIKALEEAVILLCDAIDAASWDLGQNGGTARDHAENARRLVRR